MAVRTPNTLLCLVPLILCLGVIKAFKCPSLDSYINQASKYTICPSDDLDENDPLNSESCNHTMTLKERNCSSQDYCYKTICVQILNASIGLVKFTFPFLKNYNITNYTLSLCNASGISRGVITCNNRMRKYIAISNCSRLSCKEDCSKKLSVVFRYVKKDSYFLEIIPYRGYSSERPYYSTVVEIKTDDFKDDYYDWGKPNVSFTTNNISTSYQLQIRYDKCPSGFQFSLFYNNETIHGECTAELGKNTIECRRLKENVKATCTWLEMQIIQCDFTGLKEKSNYVLRLRTLEQCGLLSDYKTSRCSWQYNISTGTAEPSPAPELEIPYLFIGTFVLGVLVLIGTTLWRTKPRYRSSIKEDKSFSMMSLPERPCVLLIYARDCQPFMEAIRCLKPVLSEVYNCEVEDYWDDSQYSVVTQNPSRWLLSRLADQRVKVMFVTNLPSLLQEAALLRGTTITYRQPTAFDRMFTLTLSSLTTDTNKAHCRVFVVKLDDNEEKMFPSLTSCISAGIRYVLPIQLDTLISALYNLSPGVSIDIADDKLVRSLESAILEYSKFLQNEPQYFYELFLQDDIKTINHILEEAQQ